MQVRVFHSGRRGFTVPELLVTISIIGVLMAIILPAVQSVRGAARSISCRNNFRQVNTALQQYVTLHRQFPATRGPSRSSFVAILPWLDQAAMYDALTGAAGNSGLASIRQPSAYICTEDPVAVSRKIATSMGENTGICIRAEDRNCPADQHDGIFLTQRDAGRATPASIKDGLSNTACYSEILGYPRPDRSRLIYTNNPDQLDCSDAPTIAIQCRAGRVGLSVWMLARGSDWVHGMAQVNQYMHVVAPNERDCLFTPGAASEHRGGIHTAFCDGSVRFVSNSVDDVVWQAAGSRAGRDGPVEW